jgi:preprotein translocase subunit YajC
MWISQAFAQAAGGGGGGGLLDGIQGFIPLILIFVVFYFLLIRPQQKKMKQHRELVANVRRGDRVVTGGGIIGQVTKVVSDGEVMLEIADGVRVRVVKQTITDVLAKGEPVKGAKKDDDEDDDADDAKSAGPVAKG